MGLATFLGACFNSCFKTRFKQDASCTRSLQSSCYSSSCFCLLYNQSVLFSADFSADSDTFSADFSNNNFAELAISLNISIKFILGLQLVTVLK